MIDVAKGTRDGEFVVHSAVEDETAGGNDSLPLRLAGGAVVIAHGTDTDGIRS